MSSKRYQTDKQKLKSEGESILRSADEENYRSRVGFVLEAINGKSTKDIAREAGRHVRTIERWINQVDTDENGFESLRLKKIPGRKAAFTDEQMQEIYHIIKETYPFEYDSETHEFKTVFWTGDILAAVLFDLYPDVHPSSRTCRDIIKKSGYKKILRTDSVEWNITLKELDIDTARDFLSRYRNGEPIEYLSRARYDLVLQKRQAIERDKYSLDEPFDDDDDDDDDDLY